MSFIKIIYFVVAIIICVIIRLVLIKWAFSDFNQFIGSDVNKTFQEYMSIPITTGMCDLSKSIVINTFDPENKNYIDLPTSVNRIGGLEMSYTFWLRLGEDSSKLSDQILFMRGVYNKGKLYEVHDEYNNIIDNSIALVKCPLVKFGNNTSSAVEKLIIEFNTLNNPFNKVELDLEVMKIVKSSLNHPRYYLITLTFKDDLSIQGEQQGVIMNVYVNDSLVKSHSVQNDAIKVNTGDILINPSIDDFKRGDPTSIIGDLTYHNFALNTKHITDIFNKGVSNKGCTINTMSTTANMTQQYESLDMYNQLKQI